MKKRLVTIPVAICVATMLLAIYACSVTKKNISVDSSAIKTVDAGITWEIAETTSLKGLTIAEGAVIKAPEGYNVTMTINGIETPIEAGIYTGNVVLTPTENIPIYYNGSGIERIYNFRTGIYVNNGTYIHEKSVAAAVVGGEVTDTYAKNIQIASVGERFNGIMVTGDSESSYSIINPEIKLSGNGGNDFAGYGAAIMTNGEAEVMIDNARIINKGCIRGAVWVGGNSIAHINNSYIEVQNGTLPEVFTTVPSMMMEVPWSLGLTGNNRATLVAEYGTAYYNNTHIKAEAWGALSTDAVEDVRLYAVDCNIESGGYGSYADRVSHNEFNGCRFDVTDYGLIMGGGDGIFTDGCVVNSDRHGVMIHNCMGTLTIDKGSVFNAKGSVILMKTAYPTIIVDDAELNSESGVIIQAIVNDDPGGRPSGGAWGKSNESMPEAPGDEDMPSGPRVVTDTSDITVLLRNATLKGDIVNAMTSKGNEIVSLENTSVTGAITTATFQSLSDIDGVEVSKETYYYIGEVKNTYCTTDDEYGLQVSLDGNSTWIVDETSYLTGLTITEGGSVIAPEGYNVNMTINGVETPIEPGAYTGNIVLTPTEHTGIYYKARSGIENTYNFSTGIYVNDGKYIPEKSVEAAVVGGEVADAAAKDVQITSIGYKFNGIIIDGNSDYSIVNPVINLTGWGGYDFAGYGAGIRIDGKAEVTIDNAHINNTGCERLAVWVGGDSIAHVNNSEIEVHNGPLPELSASDLRPLYSGTWRMGFTGNVRATLVVGKGTAYYNNTHIRAQAWGALSTDDVENVKLYAVNCHVETIESGYGSYVDRTARNEFSGCRFDVADYGLILGGGDPHGIVTDGTVVNSRRMGVMIHNNSTGKLNIDKGSVFNTKGTAIQVRTAHPTIIVDNAELNAENGIILQAIVDDDQSVYGGPGGMPGGEGGPMPDSPGGGGMPGGPDSIAGDKSDIAATFKNVNLNGDIINSMTTLGEMIVSFENTSIAGAITTATTVSQAVIDGVEVSIDTYYYMGEVKNTYCATDDEYGLQLSLDGNSSWIVDETSYLTGLTIAEGAAITAPKGYAVTMAVNGVKRPISAGVYKGKISLAVIKM